ncbi:Tigger transposable element-derived protein 4-like isoform X4 [Oopsacas minuta]|uniref:Tigger transposable element-derived protein 4-like isoform X4 n=1 Tax=Oopsacas minuta TaxID=111878 RepID=A0AAV7KBP0_9METZ|nr:Tigger transposable element-derived protein 4-like isoform X4 [Oopsacas minuta]
MKYFNNLKIVVMECANVKENLKKKMLVMLYFCGLNKIKQGARISGVILRQKATEIALANGSDFIPSDGWLGRWKLHHDLIYKQEQGKNKMLVLKGLKIGRALFLLQSWMILLQKTYLIRTRRGCISDVFLIKGYSIKGTDLPGGKKAKDRITVMLCANMSGTEKYPLLAIGMSKQPRSLPKDLSKLPIRYEATKNAWMTGFIFEKWIRRWDSSLRMNKRNICLLVDNCSAHPKSVSLTDICLKFLPANTASIMQPMDMGVIKNWKAHYKSRLNSRIINAMDGNLSLRALDIAKSITLFDALYLFGFVPRDFIQSEGYEFNLDDDHMFDDVSLPSNMSLEEFENFITIDSEIPVSGDLSDVELLDITRKKIRVEDSESDDDDDDDGDGDNLRLSLEQKLQMVDHLRIFIQSNGMTNLLPML